MSGTAPQLGVKMIPAEAKTFVGAINEKVIRSSILTSSPSLSKAAMCSLKSLKYPSIQSPERARAGFLRYKAKEHTLSTEQ
jgi:hypothetical protein